jgi:hypothetical protein
MFAWRFSFVFRNAGLPIKVRLIQVQRRGIGVPGMAWAAHVSNVQSLLRVGGNPMVSTF